MEALDLALGFFVGLLVGGVAVWLALRSAARSKELAHAARMQEAREALEKSQRKLSAMSEARAADLRRMARADAGEEEEPELEIAEEPVEIAEEAVEIAEEPVEIAEPDDEEAEGLRRELSEAHTELESLHREASLHERELHELRAETEKLGAALAESTKAFEVRDQDVEALLASNERWKSEVEKLRAALENARTESTLAMVSGVGQPNEDQAEELAQALAALEESEDRARASAAALTDCEARVAELTSRAAELTSHAADQADRLKTCEEAAPAPTTDDLTRIRGIGAVFARRLIGIGIASCRDLSTADPAAIRESLDLVDVGRVKIEDWVEDAKDFINDEG